MGDSDRTLASQIARSDITKLYLMSEFLFLLLLSLLLLLLLMLLLLLLMLSERLIVIFICYSFLIDFATRLLLDHISHDHSRKSAASHDEGDNNFLS